MGYIDTLGELEWEKVIVGEANRAICQRISLGMQDVAGQSIGTRHDCNNMAG